MKYSITILILLASLATLHAQVVPQTHLSDSLSQRIDNVFDGKLIVVDSVKNKVDRITNKVQAGVQRVQQKVDSVTHRQDSIIRSKIALLDSAKLKVMSASGKVEAFGKTTTDSLNTLISKYHDQLVTSKLATKIDSLKNLNLPREKYLGKLDSLRSINPLQNAQSKVDDAQSKVNNLSEKVAGGVGEKMNLLSKEAGGRGNLPTDINLPKANLNIGESVKLPSTSLPSVDLPSMPKVNTDLPQVNQPALNIPNDLTSKLTSKIELPGIDPSTIKTKIDNLYSSADKLTNVSDKISGYTDDLKNIKEGKIEKLSTLETDVISKLPIDKELELLQKNDQLIKDQEAQLKSFQDQEAYKKKTLDRAKKMVAQQLLIYEKQLQEATSKVSKYHNSAGTILSKKNDLPKKRDSLRKLKTIERLAPGITFQVQKPSAWLVDLNPYVRYRLTLYWSVGAGWNERIIVGSYPTPYNQTRIFGTRMFTDVVVFKGLSTRLEVEDMNMFITPKQTVTKDAGQRSWVWCYNVGIKKEFSFIPRVIGNVQFMYNLYRSAEANPYPNRFNVRFGFEPVLKKKTKKK